MTTIELEHDLEVGELLFTPAAIRFLLDTIAQRDKEIEDALATALKWERYAIVCQTERDTARAALRKYGEHTENCEVHSWDLRKAPCTCGFTAALEAIK